MYTIPGFAWHYFWCLHSPSHYLGNLCLSIFSILYVMFNKSTFEQLVFPIPTFDFQRCKRTCQCIPICFFFTFLFIWFLVTYNSKLVGTDLISIPQVRSIADVFLGGVTGMTHDSVSPNATWYAPGGCWTLFWRMWMSVLPSPVIYYEYSANET